jgi:hypothetical protein
MLMTLMVMMMVMVAVILMVMVSVFFASWCCLCPLTFSSPNFLGVGLVPFGNDVTNMST